MVGLFVTAASETMHRTKASLSGFGISETTHSTKASLSGFGIYMFFSLQSSIIKSILNPKPYTAVLNPKTLIIIICITIASINVRSWFTRTLTEGR